MSIPFNVLVAGSALALTAFAATAQADGMSASGRGAWYAGLFAGAAYPDDFDFNEADTAEMDTGFAFGGFAGMRVTDNVRAELEVSDWAANADCAGKCGILSMDVDALSILGNAWLDVPLDGDITPYVGGGIGVAGVSLDGDTLSGTSWNFAWQLGAGVRVAVSPSVTVDLGYRYKSTDVDGGEYSNAFISQDFDATAQVVQIGFSFAL